MAAEASIRSGNFSNFCSSKCINCHSTGVNMTSSREETGEWVLSANTGQGKRLQKVVDKPVLNGEELLPIEEFQRLDLGGPAAGRCQREASETTSLPLFATESAFTTAFGAHIADVNAENATICASSFSRNHRPEHILRERTILTLRGRIKKNLDSAITEGNNERSSESRHAGYASRPVAAESSTLNNAIPALADCRVVAAANAPSAAPTTTTGTIDCTSPSCGVVASSTAGGEDASVLECSAARTSAAAVCEDLRDVFFIDGVCSEEECSWLRDRTEDGSHFTYWDPLHSASPDYRSAYTVEMHHPSLAAALWDRVKHLVIPAVQITEEDEARAERDLLGEWLACGVNPQFLFARYTNGGHFSPHTDGCTAIDFNTRTLWPALLYLNNVNEGGETLIIDDRQKAEPMKKDKHGRHTADPRFVLDSVEPIVGRMLFFYYTQMHESKPVQGDSVKYIIRTDILYTRKIPLLTAPTDKEAFSMWQKAQFLAEEGMLEEAAVLFRRSVKLSPSLALIYGM